MEPINVFQLVLIVLLSFAASVSGKRNHRQQEEQD